MPKEKIDKIIERTINGGAEITALQKSSAVFAPGAAAAYMVDAIMLDKKEVLPCAAYLDGEYGIHGVVGVPVKLGRQGIENVIEIELEEAEMKALRRSAEAVRKVAELMGLEGKAK
jgi:malate dehydrogenase